jgi:hypothetical protein
MEHETVTDWEKRKEVGRLFEACTTSAEIRDSLRDIPFITHDKQVLNKNKKQKNKKKKKNKNKKTKKRKERSGMFC